MKAEPADRAKTWNSVRSFFAGTPAEQGQEFLQHIAAFQAKLPPSSWLSGAGAELAEALKMQCSADSWFN